jgi:hypothetical protein
VDSSWHRQRAIAIGLLVSLALWHLPFGGLLLYPFKLLATWMHEMSHGLVMLISGAGFDRMEIYRDTSGLAFGQSGVARPGRAAIAAAGYMGTPLCGAVLLVLGQSRQSARRILAALGALMALSTAIWIHNDFGVAAMSASAATLLGLAAFATWADRAARPGQARRLGRFAAVWLVNFVAAQACINALLDIRVLFRPNLVVNGRAMGHSDAHDMATAAGGSPALWAALWLLWSLALLFVALRLIHQRQTMIQTTIQTRPARPAPPT